MKISVNDIAIPATRVRVGQSNGTIMLWIDADAELLRMISAQAAVVLRIHDVGHAHARIFLQMLEQPATGEEVKP